MVNLGVTTSAGLKASVVCDESEFNGLAAEWDELLDNSDQRVFFLRFSWNQLWWRWLRPSDSQLFIITFRDEQSRLIGLAPFFLRQHRTAGIPHLRELLFLGTGVFAQTSEYLDVIARRGYEQPVAAAIADYLRNNREWDRFCMKEIPASSAMLVQLLAQFGDEAQVSICNRSYSIDATVDWQTLISGMSHSARQSVVRRTRKFFSRHRCNPKRAETSDDLDKAFNELVRLHQARWQSKGEPGAFALPGVKDFLREAMQASLDEGRLGLTTLEVDGRVAAVRLDFRDNHIAHAFQAGFDPAFAGESLGNVMNGLCIRACVEDGWVHEYDLMSGSAGYKEFWTKKVKDSVCVTLLRPGVRSTLFKSVETAAALCKSMLRATVPRPLRAAAHRLITRRNYKARPAD